MSTAVPILAALVISSVVALRIPGSDDSQNTKTILQSTTSCPGFGTGCVIIAIGAAMCYRNDKVGLLNDGDYNTEADVSNIGEDKKTSLPGERKAIEIPKNINNSAYIASEELGSYTSGIVAEERITDDTKCGTWIIAIGLAVIVWSASQ